MSVTATFQHSTRLAAPFRMEHVAAASVLVACCTALAAAGFGLVWLVIVATGIFFIGCVQRPQLAIIMFVGSSFFVQNDLSAGGIPVHLPDVGFLVVLAVFAIREGHRINLRMVRQPLVLASLFVVFMGCMAGINGYLSGNSPALIPGDLRPMLYYVLVWPIASFLPHSRTRYSLVLWLCLFAICGISWGMWQDAMNPDFLGYSVTIGPVTFGRLVFPLMPTFIPMQIGLLATVLLVSGTKRNRRVLIITLVIALVGLFLSLTRAGIVGFAVGIITVNIIAQGHLFPWRKMAVVVLLISCAGWTLDTTTGHVLSDRLSTTSVSDDNVASRLYEAALVFEKIKEKPIFGSGLGALHSPDQPLKPDDKTNLSSYLNPTYVHNFYLWTWFKLGIGGLIGFVTLIIAALITGVCAYRDAQVSCDKRLALAATAIVAATAIASITSPMFNDEFTAPFTIVMLGLCGAIFTRPTRAIG